MVLSTPNLELSALECAVRDAALARDGDLNLNAGLRRRHGIVHTSPELARGVVSMVQSSLCELGLSGLADPRVTVIDPACGPGAFVAATLALADPGASPRIVAVDIDGGALGQLRTALSQSCSTAERVDLRETDTLRDGSLLEHLSGLACPVVIGNPPWATAASRPLGEPMRGLLEDFRRDAAGQALGERKVGALGDSYVGFLRWASEVAVRAEGPAVIALVTNNSFLEGPVHRGVRAALLRMFDRVEIVDLGGNAMLGRPAGAARDDNVFGVRPGVAITLAVRVAAGERVEHGRLRYARLRGKLQDKLRAVAVGSFEDLGPVPLDAVGTACRFVPTRPVDARYRGWPSIAEVMPFHREGVQTNRDAVVVATGRELLLQRLRAFAAGEPREDLAGALRKLAHYDPERARRAVADVLEGDPDGGLGRSVRPLAYRPFDDRVFCPVAPLCHRPRAELARALGHSDFALLTVRKDRGDVAWRHIGVVHGDVDSSYLSARSSCRTRAFPVRGPDGADNVDAAFVAQLAERAQREVAASEAALVILATLSSPGYQRAFDAALRQDYPRLPLPVDAADFGRWLAAGRALEAAARLAAGDVESQPADSSRLLELRIGHLRVIDVAERRKRVVGAGEGARTLAYARAAAWAAALAELPEFRLSSA